VLEIGRGRVVREGTMWRSCPSARIWRNACAPPRCARGAGLSATVADARFRQAARPDLIARLAAPPALITVEQGAEGGFGAMVLHDLARNRRLDRRACDPHDDAAGPVHRPGRAPM
jgi:1-deoxy-D-xylulose-5-phosphate synthase